VFQNLGKSYSSLSMASSTQSMEQKSAFKLFAKEFNNKVLITVHGVCEPGRKLAIGWKYI